MGLKMRIPPESHQQLHPKSTAEREEATQVQNINARAPAVSENTTSDIKSSPGGPAGGSEAFPRFHAVVDVVELEAADHMITCAAV